MDRHLLWHRRDSLLKTTQHLCYDFSSRRMFALDCSISSCIDQYVDIWPEGHRFHTDGPSGTCPRRCLMLFDLEYTTDRTNRKQKTEFGWRIMQCESPALVSVVGREGHLWCKVHIEIWHLTGLAREQCDLGKRKLLIWPRQSDRLMNLGPQSRPIHR